MLPDKRDLGGHPNPLLATPNTGLRTKGIAVGDFITLKFETEVKKCVKTKPSKC